jgi:hypothetical protein
VVRAGGFPSPGERATLSPGLRNHPRDALILEAECGTDDYVLDTADRHAFIRDGSAQKARLAEQHAEHTIDTSPAESSDACGTTNPNDTNNTHYPPLDKGASNTQWTYAVSGNRPGRSAVCHHCGSSYRSRRQPCTLGSVASVMMRR